MARPSGQALYAAQRGRLKTHVDAGERAGSPNLRQNSAFRGRETPLHPARPSRLANLSAIAVAKFDRLGELRAFRSVAYALRGGF